MFGILALHAIGNLVEEEAHIRLREVPFLENFRDRPILEGLLDGLGSLLELGLLLVIRLQVLLGRFNYLFSFSSVGSSLSLLILRHLTSLPCSCLCVGCLSSSRG